MNSPFRIVDSDKVVGEAEVVCEFLQQINAKTRAAVGLCSIPLTRRRAVFPVQVWTKVAIMQMTHSACLSLHTYI